MLSMSNGNTTATGYWNYRLCQEGTACIAQTLQHIMVPSVKIEETYFRDMPRIWSCFCRAIIKESDHKYSLTGIDMMQGSSCYPCRFPKGPEIASIGRSYESDEMIRQNSDIFTRFWAAKTGRQPSRYHGELLGFIIHAHCWILLSRITGAPPIPTEFCLHENTGEIKSCVDLSRINRFRPDQVLEVPNTYGCDFYQNPLVIPALQKVITREKSRAGNTQSRPGLNIFPMEIKIMISEWVCPIDYILNDIENIQNVVIAFQWKSPDWFWRGRLKLKEGLLFELDILRNSGSPVDWQTLRLDLMDLLLDQEWYSRCGLPNRERIIKHILAIKDLGVS
ncbi:hypothetical protein N7451_000871 [Penicillium sp. IBT 35674x]|nr:hypothetical protein N7451_000871 [Penicillium sp. IBT 35674x]